MPLELELILGLRPDLGLVALSIAVALVIDFDITDFVFSSFPFEVLVEVVVTDVLWALPLDFGDEGAGPF